MSGIHLVGTVGGQAIALPADAVEAVVSIGQVVPVPGAPPGIYGMAAIRSRMLTVIDTAWLVGEAAGQGGYMAIVSVSGHGYGLMLEAVEDVVELGETRPIPTTLSPGWMRLNPVMCDHQGRVLLVVDPEMLVAAASVARARAA